MSKKDKIIKKFKSNPASVSLNELEFTLDLAGFKRISIKGSHVKFKNVADGENIIIPIHNNDCKDFYKKMVYKIIKNRI